jgi:hypothetical protein
MASSKSGGIGFLGMLTILFIAFKLLNIIDWSWIWVLAPIWIPAALAIIILIIWFVGFIILATRK